MGGEGRCTPWEQPPFCQRNERGLPELDSERWGMGGRQIAGGGRDEWRGRGEEGKDGRGGGGGGGKGWTLVRTPLLERESGGREGGMKGLRLLSPSCPWCGGGWGWSGV